MSQIYEIIAEIKEWIDTIGKRDIYQKCKFEYLVDTKKAIRVMIFFPNCIGEIMVNEDDFLPYRFVKFEAVAYVSNVPQMITHWYDKEGDTNEHIIVELEKAFKFALDFEVT